VKRISQANAQEVIGQDEKPFACSFVVNAHRIKMISLTVFLTTSSSILVLGTCQPGSVTTMGRSSSSILLVVEVWRMWGLQIGGGSKQRGG
jgi:hypothetical protein